MTLYKGQEYGGPLRAEAAEARIAALEKALEPFAKLARLPKGPELGKGYRIAMLSNCERARSLLSTKEGD